MLPHDRLDRIGKALQIFFQVGEHLCLPALGIGIQSESLGLFFELFGLFSAGFEQIFMPLDRVCAFLNGPVKAVDILLQGRPFGCQRC